MINSYFLSVTNWTRLQNLGKSLNPELWEEPWGLRCERIVRNLKQSGRQPRERRWLDKRIDNSSQYFANGWMCLPSLTAPHLNFSKTYESSDEFQMVSYNTNFWWFYTRVELLFCPWYPLFSHFLVTVAIVVCLRSLILTRGCTMQQTVLWTNLLTSDFGKLKGIPLPLSGITTAASSKRRRTMRQAASYFTWPLSWHNSEHLKCKFKQKYYLQQMCKKQYFLCLNYTLI